ncbi:hypothetical protein, variant [Aphanomyces astaci]|uniref:Uncharacterized protein n=1 Tax=Aphanomyces astaci TaxID=112090 RepID=W4GXS9_APHAT|nr:hypothetical protein, variant [Aphanomyces astaci]ETV84530.1 hypothetical protein, variant [Aphanomyces astaci]|eukprot:XP_009826222.1 hypothetical protein, variant [Aphanomyces astaci]
MPMSNTSSSKGSTHEDDQPLSKQRDMPRRAPKRNHRKPGLLDPLGELVVVPIVDESPAPLSRVTRSPDRLSMRNDQRQDAEFARLVGAAQASIQANADAMDAAAAVAAVLSHVEERHYASLALRKQHIHVLQQLEADLEAFEQSMDGTRQRFRAVANQHLHAIAELLLRHEASSSSYVPPPAASTSSVSPSGVTADENSVAMHLHEAGAAYKKAGDQRHECVPVLAHKAQGDRCFHDAIMLVRRGGGGGDTDLDTAVLRMAEAATAYAKYRESPLFDQCQLMLSVAVNDIAWSHNALNDATYSLDLRIKSARRDFVESEARACMVEALESAKQGIVQASGGQYDVALLKHVQRCNQYMSWLGRHNPATLAATGVTPAVTAALERKVHKSSIAYGCRTLPGRSEYECEQLVGHWTALAKGDVELATVLVTESALQQATSAALTASRDKQFPALLVLSDTLLTALGASMPPAFTLTWLPLLCQMTAAASDPVIVPALLRRLEHLMATKQVVHHVVSKCGLVALVQTLRDSDLSHQDIMQAIVAVVAKCTAVHPKCFNDDAHLCVVLPVLCAMLLRHAKSPALVADIISLLTSLFSNCTNLTASNAADCQLVAAVAPALAACNPPCQASALLLLRDLAQSDKRVLAQCRQHRAALVSAISPMDPAWIVAFSDQLTS